MSGRTYLFVINSLHAGGAERSLVELLPRLVDHGVTPVLACLQQHDIGFEEDARLAGYRIVNLSGGSRLATVRELRRLIREIEPDLVYTSLFDADLAGRLAAVGIDVPVMSNLANTAYDPARLADPNITPWKLRAVKAVDAVTARRLTVHFHAVSQAVKDSTVETMGVDPDRITVVRRGRELARIGAVGGERRRAMRNTLALPDDAEVVVTAGRQEYQKGHVHLVAAFAAVVAARPHAVLLIAGREGHASADLRRQIADLGLGERVKLLGHRDDVTDVMAASDLFVFPSVYEGLGGALIEAIALGLPVVASDLPAIREVVEDGGNAVLVPAGDPGALGDAIVALLGDPERRRTFGDRGREIFANEFRAEVAAERMVEMLDSVSGSGSVGPEGPALDDDEATAVIVSMHDRRKEVAGTGPWSVTGSWGSFKARFLRLRSRDGREVALKLGEGWDADDARFVADEVERLRSLLRHLPGGRVRVPRALGWSGDPAAVALRFVEGANLFHVLADPGHPVWERGEEAMAELMARCGQAIGAYHAAEPGDPSDATAHEAARADLLASARRAGVRPDTILAVEPRLSRARGYRFSPNDFTVDPEGRLVMLDPPHVRKYDYLQRDVSAFTFELHRWLLGGRPLDPGDPRAALAGELRRAFLAGYAATGPSSMADPLDDWMIRMYEVSRITGRTYGELRRRNLRTVPDLVRWAAEVRRTLGRPPAP